MKLFARAVKIVNPFVHNASFLYPLKTSENRKVEKECIGNEWVNHFPHFLPAFRNESLYISCSSSSSNDNLLPELYEN